MSIANDLVLDEKLDQLDPLRHFRNDDELVPVQPPSIHNQEIRLSFTAPHLPDPLVVRLTVDASPGCGGIAWPAGEVLASYISRRGPFEGKMVLELGSGTGLVGLAAGLLGANVWITDQAFVLCLWIAFITTGEIICKHHRPLLDIMLRNVALNHLVDRVCVKELNWGDALPHDMPNFDLILAADCVYFEPAFPLLVKTLVDLTSRHHPEILFCYKKRRKADKRFFNLLKKEFVWSDVTDDPNREVYSRESISLLKLVRKR
ncbi:putative methyltransferase-domain-containing protein [Cristinia sonorae]|uniref:Protein-lysine N-methyltransferase EFM6 n=1 Tax=Cristinia sonorae TaxID=1940300 RepID=A0A8K0XUD2_9AGAR|nr:putative methyltransferase-domain-containing protein [Cristinia sonorae]